MAGADDVDAVLFVGGLAYLIALLVGIDLLGDSPMAPVLTLGGLTTFAAVVVGVTIVPARLRWRGDVRPRNTVPRFDYGYRLKPAQIAVEERWGVTQRLADRGWVREVGRLGWREATVYLVGGKTGLVVDPWLLSRRAYLFDDTCRVGPSPTPETLNPGFNLQRKNKVLRIAQGTQVIDLALPEKSVSAVALIGKPMPVGETIAPAVAISEERLARIARADRRAARRHEFFARINARSKTNRWVAAACSLLYLLPAVGIFMVSAHWRQGAGAVVLPMLRCLGAAGVYAGRVIFRDEHEWPSLWK